MIERKKTKSDFKSLAKEYSTYSKRQLLIELNNQLSTIDYKEPPSKNEKEATGNTLWLQLRRSLSFLVCSDEKRDTRKKIKTMLDSGLIAFISQIGPIIFESGILPGITTAVAATLASLLANDLLKIGIDNFCKMHYDSEA